MTKRFAHRSLVAAPALTLFAVYLTACGATEFVADTDGLNATGSTESTASAPVPAPTGETGATRPAISPSNAPTNPAPTPTSTTQATSEQPGSDTSSGTTQETGAGDESSGFGEGMTEPDETTSVPPEATEPATTPGAPSDEVPDSTHCAPVADWDPAWAQWEEEVLLLVNENRAVGADCQTEGSFGPADPLAMDPMLRCSARLHSLDMYERDFFDHTNIDGVPFNERISAAGFAAGWAGENIAYGQSSPEQVVDTWMNSDGHCANIMQPNFTLLGVGYYPGADSWREGNQHFWTQNFGAPLQMGGGRPRP